MRPRADTDPRFRRLMFHVLFTAIQTHDTETLRKKAGLSKRKARRIYLGEPSKASSDDLAAWLWACGFELRLKRAADPGGK